MTREARLRNVAKRLLKLFGPKGERWSYGVLAVDKNKRPVAINSREAVKFCLSGAINKLKLPGTVYTWLSQEAGRDLISFNDSRRTYPHVRKFLEKVATLKAEKKSKN
jgi:hypothetical protein